MNQIYDYVVIGSDLGSLAMACALSQQTKNVALIDGQDFAGSDCRAVQFATGPISNGLHFTPDTDAAKAALGFLESLLDRTVSGPAREWPPITFEQGQFKEFLGFGENPPAFYEEVRFFTSPRSLELLMANHQWSQLLLEKFQGEFLPRSYVTKFEVDADRVVSATINGSKTLKALNFVYCGPIKSLSRLLPEGSLNQKLRSRMAKNSYWSALYLDLCHVQPVTDHRGIHILNGTTDDEIGPCAGHFLPQDHTNPDLQVSQWITFVEDGAEDESEVTAQALKKMKRQIKRAYPQALEKLKHERIRWAPLISGNGDLKLSGHQTLGDLQNFWMGSGALNPQKFWIGSLLQAQLVLAAMGFQPQDRKEEAAVATPSL